MNIHPLVDQLRFTRSEFLRCMEGISEADARRRLEPMNCISWMVGHLANQEHRYWVISAQDKVLFPELNDLVGFGKPATTPPLDEMWQTWRAVTAQADKYLDTLNPEIMQTILSLQGKPWKENVGTQLLRNIHHYWFHIGEAYAVREMLGHKELPDFVGNMSAANYRPEM